MSVAVARAAGGGAESGSAAVLGGGSGRRLRWVCRARTRRLVLGYCRREGCDGFGRRAACHHQRLRHGRSSRPGDTGCLRSGRSLRSCACRGVPGRGVRGRGGRGRGVRGRRSRGSCGATPPPAAAAWSIGPRRRSDTPSGPPAARRWRSWRPTRCCGATWRSGLPASLSPRVGPHFLGRPCPGRAAGTGGGRTGGGLRRGARSRLPIACGGISPVTRRCASATRPSTRRCSCKAGVRRAASWPPACAPGGRSGPRIKNGPALAGHGAEAVRDAIARTTITLPEQLRRSLTWDQGAEMSQHARLRIDTGVAIYFCDPHSPWQRGTRTPTGCRASMSRPAPT